MLNKIWKGTKQFLTLNMEDESVLFLILLVFILCLGGIFTGDFGPFSIVFMGILITIAAFYTLYISSYKPPTPEDMKNVTFDLQRQFDLFFNDYKEILEKTGHLKDLKIEIQCWEECISRSIVCPIIDIKRKDKQLVQVVLNSHTIEIYKCASHDDPISISYSSPNMITWFVAELERALGPGIDTTRKWKVKTLEKRIGKILEQYREMYKDIESNIEERE